MAEDFFEFRERVKKRAEPAPAEAAPPERPLTVSELTAKIDRAIKGGLPATVLVRGECSNGKAHRESGHFYFTLKDAGACIDCVMFRDDFRGLKFDPSDGIDLLATGRVAVYAQRGRYQLYVKKLEPLGQGALELAFQKLRSTLEREGLFANERKKPLPLYPLRIALVTSRSTAALQDMLKVLRRFPFLKLSLHHVPVQGDGAAEKIAGMLGAVNRTGSADVILLARGGGSLEDLWEFNEEAVARAIAASRIPVVTGIGHEVDVSIADLAADYHAHTPTEAAQVVTAQWRTAGEELRAIDERLRRAQLALLNSARQQLLAVERHEVFRRPLDRVRSLQQFMDDRGRSLSLSMARRLRNLAESLRQKEERLERRRPAVLLSQLRQRVERGAERLCVAASRRLRVARQVLTGAERRSAELHPRHALGLARQRVEAMERQLEALNPTAVLRRGFSITTNRKTGQIVRSVSQVSGGERLVTRVADGQIESVADDPRQPRLFE